MQTSWAQTTEGQKALVDSLKSVKGLYGLFEHQNLSDFVYKIRFHGAENSGEAIQVKINHFKGKSAVSRSLCQEYVSNSELHSDTSGLIYRETMLPIIFNEQIKWIKLEMSLTGSLIEKRFKYLQYTEKQDDEDIHIIVFSMIDKSSFLEAKKLVDKLDGKRLVVVGTRFDKFEEFQVSNLELKKFAASYDVEVCLVNCCLELTQENSCYTVVEALVGIVNY
eukprot:gene9124-1213_t